MTKYLGIIALVAACGDNIAPGAPEISDVQITTAEDFAAMVMLDARDPAHGTLTFTLTGPQHGTVTRDGVLVTYTPDPNYNGPDSIDVEVSNGHGNAQATIDITVTPVNDAPTAMGDSFATAEDVALTTAVSSLLANDTDIDGDALSVASVANPTNGTAMLTGTNVTFTPTANFVGMASYEYTVSDGTATATATVTIAVGGANDAPVATNDSATTNEDTAATIAASTLLANDTDPEMQTLSITQVGNAMNGSVSLSGTTVTFTPAADFSGNASFEYTVSDGSLTDVGVVTVAVAPVNDAPVAVDDNVAATEDSTATIAAATLLANDTDVDSGTLTVTQVGNAMNGSVSLSGTTITFTPTAGFSGNASFEYTVSDGMLTDVGLVTVVVGGVNDPPVAVDDNVSATEDSTTMIAASTLVANDTDPDMQTLTVTGVSNAINGSVSLSGTTITFTPSPDFSGNASFEYTVSDGLLTDVGLVTVAVAGVNDAPVAVDDMVAATEDTSSMISAATLLANDTDVDSAMLMVTGVSNAMNASVSLSGTTITFTPAANFSGNASFQYTVSDGTLTDVGVVTVMVAAVNDAPVAVDDNVVTVKDTPATIAASILLMNDTDVDSAMLMVTAVSNAMNGSVSLSGTTITFTPTAGFTGNASFEYTVSDGTLTDVGLVTVAVLASPNTPPVAVDDAVMTSEDTPIMIAASTLVGNDIDPDPQTLSVTAVSNAVNGSVSLTGSTITFTPNPDFNGTASFGYTVSDGIDTDVGLVTVTVTPVNDAPVAVDDNVAGTEDTAATIAAATLLANDTDVDLQTLTITGVSNAMNGSVSLSGTTITFTPSPEFSGNASFEYTVSDGTLTDVGLVTVMVAAVNDAPVAVDDVATTTVDTPVMIAKSTLLANDTDVDGPSLSVTVVQNAMNGSVSATSTTITFTPNSGFSGTASFEYVVSDGSATDVGLVTITVQPAIACGDGMVGGTEQCDDTNVINGDGCSSSCTIETGWTCSGQPSTCMTICGDTLVRGNEQCDDGNPVDVDGCTTECLTGVVCNAAAFPGGDSLAVEPSNGHCYISYEGESTTFAGAESVCIALGGYLATITSAQEQTTVRVVKNVLENPWIGGVDDGNDTDAVFNWVTGETFGYSNFAPGQPDDDALIDGNGECLHLVDSVARWNDTNCNITSFVVGRICEVEPQPCGDGVFQTFNGEECDDHNRTAGDGCSATCQLETGCGNGTIDGGEQCDDDNLVSGDGCSATCQRELVSIAITPANITIDQGQRVQLKATGTFGPTGQTITSDVTATATWLSSNILIATVGTGGVNNGQVEGQLAGTVNITATIGSVVGTTMVTVTASACHMTINEVQSRGVAATDEWVELYNGCTTPVVMTGWTLVYRSAGNLTATDTNTLVMLTGTVMPGEFRLYANSASPVVPMPDGTFGAGMADDGSVGLRSGPVNTGPLVDSVAWGTITAGHPFLEGMAAPMMSMNRSIARQPFDGRDSNSNSVDFVRTNPPGLPTPRATNFP